MSTYHTYDFNIEAKSDQLPLIDVFRNKEIEFGFSLQNIQTVFKNADLKLDYLTVS